MRRMLTVIGIGVVAVGCGKSAYVTLIGPARPGYRAGCPVDIIRAGQPAYPHVDIATAQVRCELFGDGCLIKLLGATCRAGGDTVYGFAERAEGHLRTMTAVIAYRPDQPHPPLLTPPPSPPPPLGAPPWAVAP
jgi:hypothetical protein